MVLLQELELQVVREVLEVFIRVCIVVDQPTFLGFVFKTISNRLDYVSNVYTSFSLREQFVFLALTTISEKKKHCIDYQIKRLGKIWKSYVL